MNPANLGIAMLGLMALVILFTLLGTALGVLTGLTPGLHVNNVALMLLSAFPALCASLVFLEDWGIDARTVGLLVAVTVVATSMAHTFLDFIPSTFLGAPDADTALSVLPAHSMLLEGRGYGAVYLSALGSFGAVLFALCAMVPIRFIIGPPLNGYPVLKENMVFVLLCVVAMMLITETKRIPYRRHRGHGAPGWKEGPLSRPLGCAIAGGFFLLCGLFGLAVLDLRVASPLGLPATVLFPALSGLFGVATLVDSLSDSPSLPAQKLERPDVGVRPTATSVVSGALAGTTVGFLPGMSGGIATVAAMSLRKEPSREQTIVTLSAINTANSFFVLVALFLILRPRSGAAIVVDSLVAVGPWSAEVPPGNLCILLMAALLSSCLAFLLTLRIGATFARAFHRVPYRKLVLTIVVSIVVMVWTFTGPVGLMVLAVSTGLGGIAPRLGVRRSHGMGVLLMPVIIMLW